MRNSFYPSYRFYAFVTLANTTRYGDAKTTAMHPWSTTHKPMLPQEKIDLDVAPEMVRVSVGIEHIKDITYDIEQSMRLSLAVPKGEK